MLSLREYTSFTAASFVIAAAACVWAAGFPLAETKEELGLEYDLTAVANGGTVRATLTISDLGKLKPLSRGAG